jgi:hypothetical protein
MILEMAANNEIDQPLMDLLQQNIEAAREAKQASEEAQVPRPSPFGPPSFVYFVWHLLPTELAYLGSMRVKDT